MTEDELKAAQDKLAADQAKLAADQKALADQNFAARNSAHTAFAASLVEAGKLAPGHKDDLVKAMNALPSEVLEFSSNVKEPPASFFMRLLGGAEPLIKFGATFSAKPGGEDGGDAATAAETARREAEARQANAWQGTK